MYTVYLSINCQIQDEKDFCSVIEAREFVKNILGDREYRIDSIPLVDYYFAENFELSIWHA